MNAIILNRKENSAKTNASANKSLHGVRAADAGNAEMQSDLGVMYLMGIGVPQDNEKAVKWFRTAADAGLADGPFRHFSLLEKI